MEKIARTEYPRPELSRTDWLCLNGQWEFEPDCGRSGLSRGVLEKKKLDGVINVPFCPESKLSGVGNVDFLNAVWYRKTVTLKKTDKRIILHFEACYYYTQVFINGVKVGEHKGGYTPFEFDVTTQAVDGNNVITVYAEGDARSDREPSGKQSVVYESRGCNYTRTTGIWQTVWIEYVPYTYLKSIKLDTDIDNATVNAFLTVGGASATATLTAKLDGKSVGSATVKVDGKAFAQIRLDELKLWSMTDPTLYDLEITISDGSRVDEVKTYFGMRKVEVDSRGFKLNGERVFMRTVLDQGYYEDGIYTAPTEEHLLHDIKISKALGFNGARLHEKVFERRFLYYADREGYLCWGEYPNWGYNHSADWASDIYLAEWMESVERDYNHPCVIGWCPLNETWENHYGKEQNAEFLRTLYRETKRVDPFRPVIDSSGSKHELTDIFDCHDYEQSPEIFDRTYGDFGEGFGFGYRKQGNIDGLPFFLSEYGGTIIDGQRNSDGGWGYGNAASDENDFAERYCAFARTLLGNPKICGLCYTQLYDVEQEQNGLYKYSREPKLSQKIMEKIAAVMRTRAANEELK